MTNGRLRAAVQGSVASCHGRSTPLDWVVASDVVSGSAAVFIRWAATRSETVQTSGVASCNVPPRIASRLTQDDPLNATMSNTGLTKAGVRDGLEVGSADFGLSRTWRSQRVLRARGLVLEEPTCAGVRWGSYLERAQRRTGWASLRSASGVRPRFAAGRAATCVKQAGLGSRAGLLRTGYHLFSGRSPVASRMAPRLAPRTPVVLGWLLDSRLVRSAVGKRVTAALLERSGPV